jgi:hypothetical protein
MLLRGSRGSDPFVVTAQELHRFADWTFRPDGLPELQVFAFGDFSQGRRGKYNFFILQRRSLKLLNPISSTSYAVQWTLVESCRIAYRHFGSMCIRTHYGFIGHSS